jgi:thiamine pyrophosphokinase
MEKQGIFLGDINYQYSEAKGAKTILFVAGGSQPDRKWLYEISLSVSEIWALDSGADICADSGIVPSIIIGDMDSINDTGKQWILTHNIKINKYPEYKDLTDLQLAITNLAETSPGADLVISGCWGGRLDHTFSNLFTGVWGMKKGINSVIMTDETESVLIMKGPSSASFRFQQSPDVISLLALSEKCEDVRLQGTEWELHNAELELYKPYSISNRLKESVPDSEISVTIGRGWLGVYTKRKAG